MLLQCVTCGGSYRDTNPDGTAYFHACPPLSSAELTAAVAGGKVALPGGESADQAVSRRLYLRSQARDENLQPVGVNKPAVVKAAGKGATVLDATPGVPPPIVV
jgi:hypothetical protein